MTMNVLGYAAPSAKAALAPYRFMRRDSLLWHMSFRLA